MKWETVRLGDIIDFSNGINFDKSAYTQGIKIVGVSDFGNLFSPNYDELSEVKSDIVKSKDLLKNGDIVFVRSNGNKELVGRCMLVKKLPYPVTYSGFCIRARINNPNSYNSVFLTYYFKSMFFRKLLSGSSVGANIQNLSQARLSNCTISIPHIQTQKRIAGILSAYDDLIENNQKQIKLLEEAAQRLYKEWFVDLRFPGHEHTAIVDGVPEGWRKVNLEAIAPVLTGKKDANFGTSDGKYYFFTCGQEPIKAPSYSFDCEAVILAGNGDFNVKLYRGQFEAYQRTYVFSPYSSKFLYLLYFSIVENMRQLSNGASGSTIKFLTKRMLEKITVIVPDGNNLAYFNKQCECYQRKKEALICQNKNLTEARDRLLPKLMSGEMEV